MFPEFAVALATPLATQMSTYGSFLPKCTTLKSAKCNVHSNEGF